MIKSRPRNLIGVKAGMLTFIRPAMKAEVPDNPGKWNTWWMTQCACGLSKIASSKRLSQYRVENTSCGCKMKSASSQNAVKARAAIIRKPCGEVAKWTAYTGMRDGAKRRGFSWAITLEDFLRICSMPCVYCGEMESIETGKNSTRMNGTYKRNSIDREDNGIGYVLDNCVPCCRFCNMAKARLSVSEFLHKARLISEKHPRMESKAEIFK